MLGGKGRFWVMFAPVFFNDHKNQHHWSAYPSQKLM
jgi:hypothetical protein